MSNTQTAGFQYAGYDDIEMGRCWFVSLDGDLWLPVRDNPKDGTVEQVREVFEPRGGTLPMRATRGFLRGMNAVFYVER